VTRREKGRDLASNLTQAHRPIAAETNRLSAVAAFRRAGNLMRWGIMNEHSQSSASRAARRSLGLETASRDGTTRRPSGRTQDIDQHVGARVRERRIMLGFTQQQLADLIGVTYQQAHKYERGINRISAGRLFEIARVLSVPVNYFFDGLDGRDPRAVSPRERMCLELARNFAQIPNERHQEALSQLARVLAAE
jgi:transcriptional regulator with XRE-family HTH domain